MTEQEKLNRLSAQFIELDEPRKDYIRDLTRKLTDIHRSCGFAVPAGIVPWGKQLRIKEKGETT